MALTVTLASLQANNTSAFTDYRHDCPSSPMDATGAKVRSNFVAGSAADKSGAPTPRYTSKRDIHELIANGAQTKVFAHWMGWFGPNQPHIDVGYNSNLQSQVDKQVEDMRSRGIDGAILEFYGGYANPKTDHQHVMDACIKFKWKAAATPNFSYALCVTKTSITYNCSGAANRTARWREIVAYIRANHFVNAAYWKVNNKFVVHVFDTSMGDANGDPDWATVAAENPDIMFGVRHNWSHAWAQMVYLWTDHTSSPHTNYLSWAYGQAKNNPGKITMGSCYPGIDGDLTAGQNLDGTTGTGWSVGKLIARNSGQTWQDGFDQLNSKYPAGSPLSFLQLITWNDNQEGTEIENGIDAALSLTASIVGTDLAWTLTGAEARVARYRVWINTRGSSEAELLGDVSTTAAKTFSLSALPAGDYDIYVQAEAKPGYFSPLSNASAIFIAEQTSNTGVTMTVAPGADVPSAAVFPYPPFLPVRRMTPRFALNVGSARSPFTLTSQYQNWNARLMTFGVELAPMKRTLASDAITCLLQARELPFWFGPRGPERLPRGAAKALVNLVRYSRDLTNVMWSKSSSAGVAAASVVAQEGYSDVSFPATGEAQVADVAQVIHTRSHGRTYSLSFDVWAAAETSMTAIVADYPYSEAPIAAVVPVGTLRTRVRLTGRFTSRSAPQLQLILRNHPSQGAKTVHIADVQVEEGEPSDFVHIGGIPWQHGGVAAGSTTLPMAWPLASSKVLYAGDYVECGNYLYMLLEHAVTDGAGVCAPKVFPHVREAIAGNTPVYWRDPVGKFRLASNAREWTVENAGIYGLAFDVVEAV